MKALEIEADGIRCDAEGCGYSDDTIELKDYESFVSAPCPKCGANLLTEEDFALFKTFEEMASAINGAIGDVDVPEHAERARMSIESHGNGTVTFGPVVPEKTH